MDILNIFIFWHKACLFEDKDTKVVGTVAGDAGGKSPFENGKPVARRGHKANGSFKIGMAGLPKKV